MTKNDNKGRKISKMMNMSKHSAKKVTEGLYKARPGDTVTISTLDEDLVIKINNCESTNGNWKTLKCWLNKLILFRGYGHDFFEIEKYKNKEVTVSQCKTCDKVDISWK